MIEIHSHLLHGLDDGAGDLDQSLQLLSDYAGQGVTDIICTPHFEPVHYQSADHLTDYFARRQEALVTVREAATAHNLPVRLHVGAEILLAADIVKLLSSPKVSDQVRLAGTDYILVELPRTLSGGYPLLDQILFRLQVSGLVPILAHPERSMKDPEFLDILKAWVDDERLLVQVNTSSFVQDPRLPAERQSHYKAREGYIWELADRDLIHFVASDAHHPLKRPVQQKLAFAKLTEYLGPAQAERLTQTNPAKILANQPI